MALAKSARPPLLVTKLDRLSRSVAFIATLMDCKGIRSRHCRHAGGQPADASRAWQGEYFSLRERGSDGCAQGVTAWPSFSGLPQGSRRLAACQTILNAIGNLLADSRQVEEFLFAEIIFG